MNTPKEITPTDYLIGNVLLSSGTVQNKNKPKNLNINGSGHIQEDMHKFLNTLLDTQK